MQGMGFEVFWRNGLRDIFVQYLPSHMQKTLPLLIILLCLAYLCQSRWTQKQAFEWYNRYYWGAGVNYIPAYADNQIEMWQKLDLDAIDKELRWAAGIGFSKLRVFLHIAPYMQNKDQFIKDIFSFLAVAKSRGVHVIPVLFDDCWKDTWTDGAQPDPVPGLHNSQWVQCPGKVEIDETILKNYVVDIITAFRNSETVVMWDLYNQVGNSGKLVASLPFCVKVFSWARSASPSQPITSGWWNGDMAFDPINQYILTESDVITFHAYCDVECTKTTINKLRKHNRPIICTEYMARPLKSKFITHLPVFKNESVWAINWGFVFGRTQTYYPWWSKEGDPVPDEWFHDVLRPDGTPFNQQEADFIKNITVVSTPFLTAQ